MKAISLIIIILGVSGTHGYVMKRIDALQDLVESFEFDSKGNFYAVTVKNDTVRKLLKLNDRKEISWAIDIPSDVTFVDDMLVTSQGDLYLRFDKNFDEFFVILKENSSTFEEIDQTSGSLFFLDDQDNLFYEREDGTVIFRPNSTIPIPIKHLEDFHPSLTAVLDKQGNIYIASYDSKVAVITKKALEEDIPYGQVFEILDDPNQEFVSMESLLIDERDDIWIVLSLDMGSAVLLKKLSNGSVETVWADSTYKHAYGISVMDRIFLIATIPDSNIHTVHYVTLDNEVGEVPKLTNVTEITLLGFAQADEDGNAYFSGYRKFSPELGPMIKIPRGELTPVPIPFDEGSIYQTFVDFNGAVWVPVEDKGIFYLPKGEVTPVKIPGVPDSCERALYTVFVNFKFKEIYAACYYDWYVAVDEN